MRGRQGMRPLIGPAALGTVLLLGGAVAWFVRPIVSAHRIGIPWQATLRASHCTAAQGEMSCTTDWPLTGGTPSSTSLHYNPLTRELVRADRTWHLTDSVAWVRLIDSTQRAIDGQGLKRLPCDTAVTGFPIADAWQLGAREIRLYASPRVRESSGVERRLATVQLVAFGANGCESRHEVRLLTPAEM